MPAISRTEEYNGTSWSGGGALSVNRAYSTGGGSQTAAISMGANQDPDTATSEEYDGTSWSAGGTASVPRYHGACIGTQTSCIWLGNATTTEIYNGTSWSSDASVTARNYQVGWGTTARGWFGTGNDGGLNHDDMWTYDGSSWAADTLYPINVVTAAASSSAATRSAVVAGGNTGSFITTTYEAT